MVSLKHTRVNRAASLTPCFADYIEATETGLTGGSIWQKEENDANSKNTPMMFKIEVNGEPYLDRVLKFAMSRDMAMAALVTSKNQILIYKVSRHATRLTSFSSSNPRYHPSKS